MQWQERDLVQINSSMPIQKAIYFLEYVIHELFAILMVHVYDSWFRFPNLICDFLKQIFSCPNLNFYQRVTNKAIISKLNSMLTNY